MLHESVNEMLGHMHVKLSMHMHMLLRSEPILCEGQNGHATPCSMAIDGHATTLLCFRIHGPWTLMPAACTACAARTARSPIVVFMYTTYDGFTALTTYAACKACSPHAAHETSTRIETPHNRGEHL